MAPPNEIDSNDVQDAEQALQDFYMKLTYYIASEPVGELNTEDAVDLLNFFCSISL